MQLDKKLVEDRDAALAEAEQREAVLENGEGPVADRMPEAQIEAIQAADRERRSQLLGAIRMILGHQRLEIGQLHMPARENRALIALQDAVQGKRTEDSEFVYASDRRDLLEQALAVLQPDLMHGDDQTARELHAQFADLTERVAALRVELTSLEDAQDELLTDHEKALLEAAVDQGDKPGDKPKPGAKPAAVPSDPDAPKPATTLTGPELPAVKPAPTTLTGPELPAAVPMPTTLTGPELPEAPPAPSTLGDAAPGDAGDATAPGDAGDGKAKRPWWRKPFG